MSLAPAGGCAADLFSGMGSASVALAKNFNVEAVDVQEYSRVVCSSLLDCRVASGHDEAFFERAARFEKRLMEIYEPLLCYEEDVLAGAGDKSDEILAQIVSSGCLLPQYAENRFADIEKKIVACMKLRLDGGLAGAADTITRYYGGTYFSYRQAIEIDSFVAAARSMPPESRDRYLASVICAASQCGSTVGGQFAQPLQVFMSDGRVKRSAVSAARRQREKDVATETRRTLCNIDKLGAGCLSGSAVRSECSTYLEGLQKQVDLVYADPPYSRYHYSRYYHVLETIAKGDEPGVSENPATGRVSRGIYRNDRYQSPYSTRTGAAAAFERLFASAAARTKRFLLSYSPYPQDRPSTPRMMTMDSLTHLARSFFRDVKTVGVGGIKHSKLTNDDSILESSEVAEVLILCRN